MGKGYNGMTLQEATSMKEVEVALESADGGASYAMAVFGNLSEDWQHFNATLISNGSDAGARLALRFAGAGEVRLSVCLAAVPQVPCAANSSRGSAHGSFYSTSMTSSQAGVHFVSN
jgi:hypothetical protein